MQDFINCLDLLVWRCVEDNDDGTDEADCAANLAQEAETFVEEI